MKNLVRFVALSGLGIVLGCGASGSTGTGAGGRGGGAGSTGMAGRGGTGGGAGGAAGRGGTGGGAGGAAGRGGTGGGGERCGGEICGVNEFCCGPPECGSCSNILTGPNCPTSCGRGGTGGAGGSGGTGGAGGSSGQGGAGGSGGQGGAGGSGGQGGGGDCTVTGCPAGQVCYSRGAGAAIVSVECIANPCAPAALACACAGSTLAVCGQLCMVDGENLVCSTRCAAPDTPIATPSGEQPIATLRPGDLVFSMHHGRLMAVPIVRTTTTPAAHHHVMRVTLETERVLMISPGHPTAEGGTFAELRAGARLGERRVVAVALVPYPHAFTYDILPESDSGTYVASGALVGSTLAPRQGP